MPWRFYTATGQMLMTTTSAEYVEKATFDANTILKADSDDTPVALTVAEQTVVGRITGGNIAALTAAQVRTLVNVEDGADVTDAANVDAAGAVMEADFNAQTVLAATADDTPAALTVAEQTVVGRITAGDVDALTASEVWSILDDDLDTDLIPDADGTRDLGSALNRWAEVHADLAAVDVLRLVPPSELTIAAGAVTKTKSTHVIDTQDDDPSDDLDTISGGTEGDLLAIMAAHTDRTVVVKHGTGNIQTFDGADITLDSTEQVVLLYYDGSNWLVVSGGGGGNGGSGLFSDYAIIQHQETSGTHGGSSVSGAWYTRPLNTEVADTGSNVAVSSNQLTIEAGTYLAIAWSSLVDTDGSLVRLYNVTDTALVANGHQSGAQGANDVAVATVTTVFTLASQKVLELQYRVATSNSGDGLGKALSWDGVEVYASVLLLKLS